MLESINEADVIETLDYERPNGMSPTTHFLLIKTNDGEETVVTHSGGMLNLSPVEGVVVPDLKWEDAVNWKNGGMIQNIMPHVDPEWRDFLMSGLKPGEL